MIILIQRASYTLNKAMYDHLYVWMHYQKLWFWTNAFLAKQSQSLLSNSSKIRIICSDFDELFLNINAYLWGSIITAIIFCGVIGLTIGSGLYLWYSSMWLRNIKEGLIKI